MEVNYKENWVHVNVLCPECSKISYNKGFGKFQIFENYSYK